MRDPRYKFPDEVRNATRSFASQVVAEGRVPQTAEELQERIAATPSLEQPLVHGGYGDRFTAHDLFPLFEVFVTRAGGSIRRITDVPPPSSPAIDLRLVAVAAVVVVAVIALVALL